MKGKFFKFVSPSHRRDFIACGEDNKIIANLIGNVDSAIYITNWNSVCCRADEYLVLDIGENVSQPRRYITKTELDRYFREVNIREVAAKWFTYREKFSVGDILIFVDHGAKQSYSSSCVGNAHYARVMSDQPFVVDDVTVYGNVKGICNLVTQESESKGGFSDIVPITRDEVGYFAKIGEVKAKKPVVSEPESMSQVEPEPQVDEDTSWVVLFNHEKVVAHGLTKPQARQKAIELLSQDSSMSNTYFIAQIKGRVWCDM